MTSTPSAPILPTGTDIDVERLARAFFNTATLTPGGWDAAMPSKRAETIATVREITAIFAALPATPFYRGPYDQERWARALWQFGNDGRAYPIRGQGVYERLHMRIREVFNVYLATWYDPA